MWLLRLGHTRHYVFSLGSLGSLLWGRQMPCCEDVKTAPWRKSPWWGTEPPALWASHLGSGSLSPSQAFRRNHSPAANLSTATSWVGTKLLPNSWHRKTGTNKCLLFQDAKSWSNLLHNTVRIFTNCLTTHRISLGRYWVVLSREQNWEAGPQERKMASSSSFYI